MDGRAEGAQATLGGGCFWCLEAVLSALRGVEEAVSGYGEGGTELVQVRFSPGVISYADLMQVFLLMHDPTLELGRTPRAEKYRSVIFYHDAVQQETAERVILALQPQFGKPILTAVEPFRQFSPAGARHQGYYRAGSTRSHRLP